MTEKTRTAILAEADASLPDNDVNAITAEDVRRIIKDLADSSFNPMDDDSSDIANGSSVTGSKVSDALDTLKTGKANVSDIGTIASQDADDVVISGGSIAGITDLAVADGGTGASTAADARANIDVYSKTETDSAISTAIGNIGTPVVLKGSWDASAGTFPGGAGTKAGWSYIVSVAGTVDSVDFSIGDRLIQLVDDASTSAYADDWLKSDYSDLVTSVAGRTGNVTLSQSDVAGSMAVSTYDPNSVRADAFNQDNMVAGLTNANYTQVEKLKLASMEDGANFGGPSSSGDGNLVAFDGTHGDRGKDSGKSIADLVQKAGTDASDFGFVNTGTLSSDTTKLPVEGTVKAYVDGLVPAVGDDGGMLVDDGGARTLKTPAQVRTALSIIPASSLPFIVANENGVDPLASDNASALQTLVSAVSTAGGGKIVTVGPTKFATEIDMQAFRNVILMGTGGLNPGTAKSQLIFTGTGAVNGFKLGDSLGSGFEDVQLSAADTAFAGVLANWDGISGETDYPIFRRSTLSLPHTVNANAVGIGLDGAVGGNFDGSIQGGGKLLRGVLASGGNGYSNNMKFNLCIQPYDQYPVYGVGQNWKFDGGYVQAGASDAVGRFIYGFNTTYPFRHLSIRDMGWFDSTATGTVWLQNMVGRDLSVRHCNIGVVTAGNGYGMILDSVVGVDICYNEMMGQTSATILVGFDAPPTGKPTTDYGEIKFNRLNQGQLLASVTNMGAHLDIDGNYSIDGGGATIQVQKPWGGPTTAGSTGTLYEDTAASNVLKVA